MGITRGRKYPGVSDGLIFAFDPKNRDCWSGGSTSFTDLVNGEALTGNNMGAAEMDNAVASEGSIDFDGTNDFIDSTDAPRTQGDITVMFWLNPTDYGAGASGFNQRPAHAYDGSKEWQIIVSEASVFKWGSHSTKGYNAGTTIAARPALGTWSHIACVREGTETDNNSYNVYYSGSLQTRVGGTPGGPDPASSKLRLGACMSGAGVNGEYDGKIGSFLIYNRALSPGEIKQNYEDTKARYGL